MLAIRARSPLRISFGGGGTDVSPYVDDHGGLVLNATVDKYAYASLRPSEEDAIIVSSLDYDFVAKYVLEEPLAFDGRLDLVKAVIRRLNGDPAGTRRGLEVYVHNDAPPGSGLGGSSALVVALVGAFRQWRNLSLSPQDVAELAFEVERVDLGLKGGRQDQFASAFGGINVIEFSRGGTKVNPVALRADTLYELQYNLLLCYTGQTRRSDPIIEAQVRGYIEGTPGVVRAMDDLKAVTSSLTGALSSGDLDEFGRLLDTAWQAKKRMAPSISNPRIDRLYEAARGAGALGGKVSGAGGGGYMFFYCPFGRKPSVAAALERLGARVVPFNFEFKGLQVWQAGA